jgi:hypothetical protein
MGGIPSADAILQGTGNGQSAHAARTEDAGLRGSLMPLRIGRKAGNHYVRIESQSFSWMDEAKALKIIRRVLAGEFDDERYGVVDASRIQSPEELPPRINEIAPLDCFS